MAGLAIAGIIIAVFLLKRLPAISETASRNQWLEIEDYVSRHKAEIT